MFTVTTIRRLAFVALAALAAGTVMAEARMPPAKDGAMVPVSFAQGSATPTTDDLAAAPPPAPVPPVAVRSEAAATSSKVPEPSTYAMLAAGLGVVLFVSRRRRQQD